MVSNSVQGSDGNESDSGVRDSRTGLGLWVSGVWNSPGLGVKEISGKGNFVPGFVDQVVHFPSRYVTGSDTTEVNDLNE